MQSEEYRFGEHYQELKKRVLEIAERYRCITNLDQEKGAHAGSVRIQIELLKQGKFTIVIAGEVSSGKSTLINALLGDPILPTSVLQSTSAIVEIVKSHEKVLRVIYADKHEEEIRDNPSTPEMDESSRTLKELGAVQTRFRGISTGLINSCLIQKQDNLNLQALFREHYNETRPHQALFGYTPAEVHTTGNKTRLVEEYRQRVRLAQEQRLQKRVSTGNQQPTPFFS